VALSSCHAGYPAHRALSGGLFWEWPRPKASCLEEILVRGDLSWRMVGAGGILYVPGPTLCAVRASDDEQLWQLPTGGLPALVALPG